MKALRKAVDRVRGAKARAVCVARARAAQAAHIVCEESAQGTTEYAILVGVLVVIAILAIITFRERVSELWGEISDGINSL